MGNSASGRRVGLILTGSQPVLGNDIVTPVLFGAFQLIFEFLQGVFSLLFYLLYQVVILIEGLLELVMLQLIPGAFQVISFVFDFFLSIATLMIRSVSHVAISSYETLVQLDWRLAFQTLGGFVLVVLKMAATCVSVVLSCFEFITTQFITLLITLVSITWKIASFVFIHSWYIIVKIVEIFGILVVSISELISAVINGKMSSNPLKNITVTFCAVSIIIVSLLLMKSVPFRKVYRHLAQKFQELARDTANPEQRSRTVRRDDVRPDGAAMVQRNDRSPDTSLRTRSPTIRHRHPRSLDLSPSRKEMERELSTVKRLLEKHEDSKLCAVCLDNPRTMIVKPCRHYCLCERCQNELRKCPICNRPIMFAEKIYDV